MCVNKPWQLQQLSFLQGFGRNAGANGHEILAHFEKLQADSYAAIRRNTLRDIN